MDPDEPLPDAVEETAPMTKLPNNSFCLLLNRFAMDVTWGSDSGISVSRNNLILLRIVQGMTYGTAGAPNTAAAIAVYLLKDTRNQKFKSSLNHSPVGFKSTLSSKPLNYPSGKRLSLSFNSSIIIIILNIRINEMKMGWDFWFHYEISGPRQEVQVFSFSITLWFLWFFSLSLSASGRGSWVESTSNLTLMLDPFFFFSLFFKIIMIMKKRLR